MPRPIRPFIRDKTKSWDIPTKLRSEIHRDVIKLGRVGITYLAFRQGFPGGEYDLRVFCAMYRFKFRRRLIGEDKRIKYVVEKS